MKLETRRLVLREFERNDWRAVHEYASDPEVTRYVGWGPNTKEETKEFIERVIQNQEEEPRQDFDLALITKENEELIGTCGIHVVSSNDKRARIGYVINRGYWAQGYATEAAKAVVGFGFRDLGMHRIGATCDPRNTGSVRVLEKLGMSREGHLRDHVRMEDRWRDSYIYAVLEDEWSDS